MKNPHAYHEQAVQLARALFPELSKVGNELRRGGDIDAFAMKVSTIERHIVALLAPLEAAANHDVSPYSSLETTIRRMNDELVDLRGYRAQNGS